jgi:hypothetical protein
MVLRRDRQRRRRLVAQRSGTLALRMAFAADLDALAFVEAFAQRVRSKIQRLRRQQRAFQVVSPLFVTLAGVRPELVGSLQRAVRQHRQRVL